MSFTLRPSPELLALLSAQDGVATHHQLHALGFNSNAISRRLRSGVWQRLLPRVILTKSGTPTRRQKLVAAWLWAGEDAAIDGADACAWHGWLQPQHPDQRVHVVAPSANGVRSHSFVAVRRTIGEIVVGGRGIVPYVDAPTALVVAARDARSQRSAVAMFSRALQQQRVSIAELEAARSALGDKWCRHVDPALVAVGVGLRSPAEKDNCLLIRSSKLLPEPLWNQWLDLGDGGCPVCVDALWEDAGLVQEVLGKTYHAWGEQFENTEARRARLVAAGLVMQGATPAQVRQGATLLQRLERTFALNAGRGMPPGVRLVDPPGLRAWVA